MNRFDQHVWIDDRLSAIVMFGGSSAPSQTTTTSSPWSAQIPYLEQGFQTAQNLENGPGPQYYPGQTYAPLNTTENQAINSVPGVVQSNLGGIDSSASNFDTSLLNGGYLYSNPGMPGLENFSSSPGATSLSNFAGNPNIGVSSNPATSTLGGYSSGAEASAGNPYTAGEAQSVLSSVVPQIQSQFINGGALDSPEAAYATSAGATSALAPTLFGNYTTEQGMQLGAANTLGSNYLTGAGLSENAGGTLGSEDISALTGLGGLYDTGTQQMVQGGFEAPSVQSMPYTDLSNLYGSGAATQSNEQNTDNAAVSQWNYDQTLPYQMLNQYMGAVSGNYGGTVSEPYFSNSTGNTIADLTGAAVAGNSLFGSSGLFPGAASSAVAALGSISSDRRLKKDITFAGVLPNGLNLYWFRFRGEDEWQFGLMADEVERVKPETVSTDRFGFKRVDYDRAMV